MDIEGISGIIHEKRAFERMTSKLVVLNPLQAIVLLKKTFAIPKLQYVPRASTAYLCREELRVFDRTLIDPLGRVANLSLEGMSVNRPGSRLSFGLVLRRYRPVFFHYLYELCGRVGGNFSF